MNDKNHSSPQGLAHQQILEVGDGAADALVCLSGTLWVTACGDSADIVLTPGQRLSLRGMTGVVVQALGPARYRLARAATRPGLVSGLVRWLRSRADTWLEHHPAPR